MNDLNLVPIDEYGLLGESYYWVNRKRLSIKESDLCAAGISDDRVLVHKKIIEPLLQADYALRRDGYRLFVKEGWRPDALYDLAYKNFVRKHGKKKTDRLFNLDDRPHTTGCSVDVVLCSKRRGGVVHLRGAKDGQDACFVDFYRDKTDAISVLYHHRQQLLIRAMFDAGFRLGRKREYWHFDYKPDSPFNYDFS